MRKTIFSIDIAGVFFDLYGTLIEYGDLGAAWDDWLNSLYDDMRAAGLSIEKSTFSSLCDCFFLRDVLPLAAVWPGLTLFELRVKDLCCRCNITVDDTDIAAIASRALEQWCRHMRIDPEAETVLSELKKTKKISLITNFDHPPHVRSILIKHKLFDYFDCIIVSGQIGIRKPNPEIFAAALEKTALRPPQAVFIGDSWKDDICGARVAGLTPILIKRDDSRHQIDYQNQKTVDETSHKKTDNDNSCISIRNLSDLLTLI
ncbi:MAG: HAD family hydrolase [Chitinivibrionales bacterium]|nr:HAD family hydrolase [Chitinivibrionales bacterium]